MYSLYFPLMALARYAAAVGLPLRAGHGKLETENLLDADGELASTEYRVLSTKYEVVSSE
jgi:hypothetical protein